MVLRTLLAIGLMIMVTRTVIMAQSNDGTAPLTVIQLDTTKPARAISPVFYGIAHPRTNGYDHPNADEWNQMLQPFIRELKPQHMRGPSGTGGNFWLWREGRHMTPRHPQFTQFYDWAPQLVIDRTDSPIIPLKLDRLLATADSLNIPYVFNTNTIAQSVKDNVDLACELAKHYQGKTTYMELGNEFYAIHYKKPYPRAQDYFNQARTLCKAIKSAAPNTKVSVVGFNPVLFKRIVADPNNYKDTDNHDWEFTIPGRCEAWRQAVVQNSDVGDAVTVHYYARGRHMERMPTQKHVMDHFFCETAFFTVEMEELIAKLNGREVWMTEWNLMLPDINRTNDMAQRARMQILKTFGSGLIRMDLLGRMLDEPAITVTSFHSLMSGNGFGIVQRDEPNSDEIIRTPVFYMLKAFGQILADNPMYYNLADNPVPSTNAKPQGLSQEMTIANVGRWVVGDHTQPRIAIMINRTGESQKVQLNGYQLHKVWEYGGTTLPLGKYPEATLKEWFHAPKDVAEPQTYPNATSVKQLELAPYSMIITKLSRVGSE